MILRHVGMLALLTPCLGSCCPISVDLEPSTREDAPKSDDPRIDLGNAEHPAGNDASPSDHPWWVPKLEPQQYRLGYKLPAEQASLLVDAYHRWADAVGHQRLSDERFQWRPEPRCFGGLHCVYEELDDQDGSAVHPIAEIFRGRASTARLSALDATALIVTFVQEIDYRIPQEEPFGVLPPAIVVKNKWGDCDSKALLAHMLLRSLGIQTVLISSQAHKHTMLGVALPSAGESFEWQGRRYAFVELTAKRSPIGHIDPRLTRPNDWQVVQLPYTATGYDVTPAPPQEPDAPDSDGGRVDKPKPKRGGPRRPPPNTRGGGKIRRPSVVTPMSSP